MAQVLVVGVSAVDAGSRRCDVHHSRAPVREARDVVPLVGRCYADHVRPVVIARVRWGDLVVPAIIPGRADEEVVRLRRGVDGVDQGLRVAAPTPGVGTDVGAHHHGVVYGADRIRGAAAVGSQELQGHDLRLPRDPGHADGVAGLRTNGTGAVRTVAVRVHRISAVGVEIVSVDIVHVAVVVVVDAVAGDLTRVDPHLIAKVFVVVVHAGVLRDADSATDGYKELHSS